MLSWSNQQFFNVVAPGSKEPIEDLLFPNVGSTSDVPSDIAFHVSERVGASTDESKMVRITAGSMGGGHSFWTE